MLDEHFSFRIGVALRFLRYPIQQVQLVRELGRWEPGAILGKGAQDPEIAQWCGQDFVLVTCDDDFRSRPMRIGVLKKHGVSVIFVSRQPVGLQAQVELIVRHFPHWKQTLDVESRPSAWVQPPNGRLRKIGS